MRRTVLVVAVATTFLVGAPFASGVKGPKFPGPAVPPVGTKDNGFSKCDERYLNLYLEASHKQLDPGRNLVDDGRSNGHVLSNGEACQEADQLYIRIHPPPPPPEPVATTTTTTSTGYTQSSYTAPAPVSTGSGDCPSYTAGESSSSTQYNTQGSGAYGCYQIMPGTAASYGCNLSSLEGQTSCAGEICADVGNSAWESSGIDPCPYVQP